MSSELDAPKSDLRHFTPVIFNCNPLNSIALDSFIHVFISPISPFVIVIVPIVCTL